MKQNYVLSFLLVSLFMTLQVYSQVNVTFKVDMSSETVSADGVHIVGTVNGWNTSSTQLTQEGATGIYSVTVLLDTGWHRFKYLNGSSWGTEEQANYPCATSSGDRFLYINNSGLDVDLELVPFNGCNSEGTGFSIMFNVDMTSESTISGDGVHITGWFNDWNTSNLSLPDVNGAIHSATLRFPTPENYPIDFEYKYLNGNTWGTDETLNDSCSSVTGSNRLVTVSTSGESLYDVFNGCNYSLSVDENNFMKYSIVYIKEIGLKIKDIKYSNTGKLNVDIYNISGRLINSKTYANINEEIISMGAFKTGVYIARISDETNRVQNYKFIKY
ncbi:T9SS type A sorting domain-containing protein [Lutibacter sp. TH_r2]|uniref:T9SS type A sorting domain-containing protein n=1 Tax=Lutibacter sp. TH_r2 TaxID=3082083 RepID=UPI002952A77D|nr:T9SS type A sorting domain-containing protein [Lutibacter sp. TH_r2]MDV7188464.1 T9SS type A sorting domain-containing protein [Lutibacter sp. TH_r2]